MSDKMNVKKGDRAVLVPTGEECAVVEYVGEHAWPDMTLGRLWRVEFDEPVRVYMAGSDGKMHTHRQTTACVEDSSLRRIETATEGPKPVTVDLDAIERAAELVLEVCDGGSRASRRACFARWNQFHEAANPETVLELVKMARRAR